MHYTAGTSLPHEQAPTVPNATYGSYVPPHFYISCYVTDMLILVMHASPGEVGHNGTGLLASGNEQGKPVWNVSG